MWDESSASRRPQPPTPTEIEARNRGVLRSTLVLMALALLVSLPLPAPMVPAMLEASLFFAAVGAGLLGILSGQSFAASHLTRFDQGLFLVLCSRIAGLFVDREALGAALDAVGGG